MKRFINIGFHLFILFLSLVALRQTKRELKKKKAYRSIMGERKIAFKINEKKKTVHY